MEVPQLNRDSGAASPLRVVLREPLDGVGVLRAAAQLDDVAVGSRTKTETWPSRPNVTGPWVIATSWRLSAAMVSGIEATRSATCV